MTDGFEVSESVRGGEAAQDVRHCRYGRCRRPLPVVTRPGRKPEYCEDRRWEDGKTCKQMGQAEQRAERAAGLEVPLAAYQAATERLAGTGALAELRDRIDQVLASAADIDTAALARVRDAEESMSEAIVRAQNAEAGQKAAEDQRADALRQAKADREALTVAERRVRDAERELEEKTTAAWMKVVEAEAAKGAAEGQRDEATANLRAYMERFDELAKRANGLTDANKKLTSENTRLVAEAKAQAAVLDDLQERLDRQRRDAEAEAARVAEAHGTRVRDLESRIEQQREELAGLRAGFTAAEQARDQAQQDNVALRTRVDELRDQLGEARGKTQALEDAAERARVDTAALRAELAETSAAAAAAGRGPDTTPGRRTPRSPGES